MKYFSALTACVLSSLRFVPALYLALLLGWALVEIYLNVNGAPAVFVALTIFALAVLAGWRWRKPAQFGAAAASNGSLNLVPMAILDIALLFSAIWIADRFRTTFNTLLLPFVQTLIHQLTS